jgi:tRNA(Arg) A34 adenosine deaminase TadA
MLLAYAVVLKNWQTNNTNPQRGHNIGSVLVDRKGKVVFWARNCNKITGNGTEHGEVRLIRNYLAKVQTYNLKHHTVYTTLEPCAMCSGMMILTNIKRTVYGQTDPGYGRALERLALDSHTLPNGFYPYPRVVKSEPSKCIIRQRLDEAYKNAGVRGITRWLRSDEAKKIYEDALNMFLNYKVKYPEKPSDS